MATVFAVSVPGCSYVRPELVPAKGTYTSSALCAAYLPLHKKSPTSVLLGPKRKSPRRMFQSRYQLRIRLLVLNSVHSLHASYGKIFSPGPEFAKGSYV